MDNLILFKMLIKEAQILLHM